MRLIPLALILMLSACVVYNDGNSTGVITPVGTIGGGGDPIEDDEIKEP